MSEPSPVDLVSSRVQLTMLPPDDAARVLAYFVDNREHLGPWDPPRPPGFLSLEFWRWRLAENRDEYVNDRSLRLQLLARDAPAGPVIGQVNFTQFVRGPLQQCFLGYSLDHRYEGRGLMTEALGVAVRHVFDRLAMHRVSANYMPHNQRSGRVLERLGFSVEGRARAYLYIGGEWRDHVLTALVNDQLASPGGRVQ